jgi:hypothetical protein
MRVMLRPLLFAALTLVPAASPAQPAPAVSKFKVSRVAGAAKNTFSLSEAAVAGAVLSEAGEARAISPEAKQVVIPAQHLAIFKTARVATRVAVAPTPAPDSPTPPVDSPTAPVKWVLPYEFTFASEGGVPRSSHLVAEVAGKLHMVSGAEFGTELLLRLEDVADATQRYALPQPAEVVISAAVDRVDPEALSFSETAVWKRVVLRTAHPGDSVDARVYSSVDGEGLALDIGIERPTLAVRIDRPSIQGLGLETAEVTVSVRGLPEPAGREVALDVTQRGGLERVLVPLDAQGFASTKLRSIRIGSTAVHASHPQLGEATSNEIAFETPWAFAIAALLGGGAGAAIKRLTTARRAKASRVLVAGLLSGVGGAVVSASGINLLHLDIPAVGGEALVASLALLFALTGLRAPSAAGG